MAAAPEKKPAATIQQAIARAAGKLSAGGVEPPRLTAELLVAHATAAGREYLFAHPEQPLHRAQQDLLTLALERRLAHEPLQHVLGAAHFRDFTLKCDGRALVPRPETELLVELLAELWAGERERRREIADLGVGGACLTIAILREFPNARIWATDVSGEALALARENILRHGLAARAVLELADLWPPGEPRRFDAIVGNLPYIPSGDLAALAPEVRDHDPRVALDGGPDGLSFIRRAVQEGPAYLKPGGYLLLEIGQGQAAAVVELCRQAGLTAAPPRRDFAGLERVIQARHGKR